MLNSQHKKTRRPTLKFKRRAIDILYAKMMFYNEEARLITEALIKAIKAGATARGDLLVELNKELNKYNAIVIECASKLAPYQSSRLNSLEVNQKVIHRFVVAAPKLIADKDTWLDEVNKEQNTKVIDITPKGIGNVPAV